MVDWQKATGLFANFLFSVTNQKLLFRSIYQLSKSKDEEESRVNKKKIYKLLINIHDHVNIDKKGLVKSVISNFN